MNMNNKNWINYRDEMPNAERERFHCHDTTGDGYFRILRFAGGLLSSKYDYAPDTQWCYADDDEKPQDCPACETNSSFIKSQGSHYDLPYRVTCDQINVCGLTGPWASTKAEATAIWNRISFDDEPDEMREILASGDDREDALISAAKAKE